MCISLTIADCSVENVYINIFCVKVVLNTTNPNPCHYYISDHLYIGPYDNWALLYHNLNTVYQHTVMYVFILIPTLILSNNVGVLVWICNKKNEKGERGGLFHKLKNIKSEVSTFIWVILVSLYHYTNNILVCQSSNSRQSSVLYKLYKSSKRFCCMIQDNNFNG